MLQHLNSKCVDHFNVMSLYPPSNLQQKREVVRNHSEDEEMESQEEEESFGKFSNQKFMQLPEQATLVLFRGESNRHGLYYVCGQQFMQFFFVSFSLLFCLNLFLAFNPALGMLIHRKRKQRSQNEAEKLLLHELPYTEIVNP